MFLRSLLAAALLFLGVVSASGQVYTVVGVDVSGSVPTTFIHEGRCPSVVCGQPFVSATRRAVAVALSELSDPVCGGESYVMIGQWSDNFSVLLPWLSLSNQDDRFQSVESTQALLFQTSGSTYHRQSFHEAAAYLSRISPTIGTIIFVTDDDVRSDSWEMGREGYNLAEAMGFNYVEIVVTTNDTLESLTAQLLRIFTDLHTSPFLCLG